MNLKDHSHPLCLAQQPILPQPQRKNSRNSSYSSWTTYPAKHSRQCSKGGAITPPSHRSRIADFLFQLCPFFHRNSILANCSLRLVKVPDRNLVGRAICPLRDVCIDVVLVHVVSWTRAAQGVHALTFDAYKSIAFSSRRNCSIPM